MELIRYVVKEAKRLGKIIAAHCEVNDLLRGGFGVHEYGQPLRIKWLHYSKSKEDLGQLMMLKIMEIILDHDNSGHHCTLELYD